MLTVHHLQRSQSERILWLCEELSVPYTPVPHRRDHIVSPPELLTVTPLGAAPVITDTTFLTTSSSSSPPLLLAESAAIVEYIIHQHGGGRLVLPLTHPLYADYLCWFHLANGTLQPTVFRTMQVHRLFPGPSPSSLPHSSSDDARPARLAADARLTKILAMLDARLREVSWLAGDEFTAADIMTVFSLTTMLLFFPFALHGYDGVLAWLRRVGEWEAYRKAMAKGKPGFVPISGAERPERFFGA